jgi:hypothetical protein
MDPERCPEKREPTKGLEWADKRSKENAIETSRKGVNMNPSEKRLESAPARVH